MTEAGYRKNVGIVLFNQAGRVLLCARNDQVEDNWQFPQGGVESGEEIESAAVRELYEETGVKSVKLVAEIPECLRYDFPENFKLPFKGQEQHWFLFYFTGSDDEIRLDVNSQEIEFRSYRWGDINEAPKLIIDFKKEVYYKVVNFFNPIINDYLRGKTNGV